MSRKKRERQKISESWLLPYADMLTLLLALFIILFAASEVDSQKYEKLAKAFQSEFSSGSSGILDEEGMPQKRSIPNEEQPQEEDTSDEDEEHSTNLSTEQHDLQEMKEKIDKYVSDNEWTGKFSTELTVEGLKITILDNVFFDEGSAEVKEDAKRIAEEVAHLLYSEPPHEVVVNGHTDDIPISNFYFSSNWELSVARAVNFMKVILENENLDPTMFSAKGYGEHKPAVPNTNEENRQMNRRVEILVLPNSLE